MDEAIIEIVLQCAVACGQCREVGRPTYEMTMEHGERWIHKVPPKEMDCKAGLLWATIQRLQARSKR